MHFHLPSLCHVSAQGCAKLEPVKMLRSQSVSSSVEQDIRYRIQSDGEAVRINKWILYLPLFVRIKPSQIKRSRVCTLLITIGILLGLILTIELSF